MQATDDSVQQAVTARNTKLLLKDDAAGADNTNYILLGSLGGIICLNGTRMRCVTMPAAVAMFFHHRRTYEG